MWKVERKQFAEMPAMLARVGRGDAPAVETNLGHPRRQSERHHRE